MPNADCRSIGVIENEDHRAQSVATQTAGAVMRGGNDPRQRELCREGREAKTVTNGSVLNGIA